MSERTQKVISICIPTYNRSDLLIELLDSILRATRRIEPAQIEICISDNASDDGTDRAVGEWTLRHSIDVVYRRWPRNLGPGANYINAAALATGQYIWFMGSDDALREDAFEVVMNALDSRASLYLTGRVDLDFSMKTVIGEVHFVRGAGRFDFSDAASINAYLDACCGVGGLYSYLSSLIVRADCWRLGLGGVEKYTPGAYPHVYVLLNALLQGATKVEVIPAAVVNNRGGNDSFQSGGNCNRVLIDLEGYLAVFDGIPLLVTNQPLRNAFNRVVLREHSLLRTLLYLRHYGTEDEWKRARRAYRRLGVSAAMLTAVGCLKGILRLAYRPIVRRAMRKILPYRRPGY